MGTFSMARTGRIEPWVVCLAGLVGGVALARAPSPPTAPPLPTVHADAAFTGVTFWDFRRGTLTASGRATSLIYDRSNGSAQARAPVADLPRLRGDPRPVHVEAGAATGQLGAQEVDAQGGVLLRRVDGQVRTATAHYDGRAQRLVGHQPAVLTTPRFTVQGTGFSVDTQSGQVELTGPVSAHGTAAP